MNNTNIVLHKYQQDILKKLVFKRKCRFNELLIEGLESEHMNYHLKKLIKDSIVEKNDDTYILTDSGKEYSDSLDDNIKFIEKQPKTSIIIRAVRKNPKTQQTEHLLNKRLREPYYGKVGRLAGKVQFGETLEQAAARELFEETGLKAQKIVLEEIYRKMRYRKDGKFVQDVIFYIFFVSELKGKMIKKTEYQENFWISEKDAGKTENLDLYDDFIWVNSDKPQKLTVTENIALADGF